MLVSSARAPQVGPDGDIELGIASPVPWVVGAYVHGAPWAIAPLDDFEELAERRLDIVMWYQDWVHTRDLDISLVERVSQRGSMPMITWDPWDYLGGKQQPEFSLASILAGTHDDHVRRWAQGLAAYRQPVLLRWAHEMNGTWYPWGRGQATPVEYRAAWRRIRSIFEQAEALNVSWVWSPNIVDGASRFEPWYPGDDEVDWVALDGYNWGGGEWKSFRELFEKSYDCLARLTNRPVMVAELGCAEGGGDKAAWITDALTVQIPGPFSRIRAVVWFNSDKERDWRIDSAPASRAAFASACGRGARRDTEGFD